MAFSKRDRMYVLAALGFIAFMLVGSLISRALDRGERSSQRAARPDVRSSATCLPVPDETLAAIAEGLTVYGGGRLERGFAVASRHHRLAFYVGARILGEGMGEGDIGVWLTNDYRRPDMILAVPHTATEFSDWPDASTTDANARYTDPETRDAVRCVEDP